MRHHHVHHQGKRKLDVANWAASGISYGRWFVHPGKKGKRNSSARQSNLVVASLRGLRHHNRSAVLPVWKEGNVSEA
jgi:hypothetical protein